MNVSLRRLIGAFLSVWLAFTLCFFVLRLLPGDAIESALLGSGASPADLTARRDALGLGAPLGAQYGKALSGLLRGDLGVSLLNGLSVRELIAQNLPPTIELAAAAMGTAIVLGIVLGTAAAAPSSVVRRAADGVIAVTLSVPIYWTGTIAVFILAGQLNWLPSGGAGRLSQLILPASVLGFHTAGSIASVLAAGLRETQTTDYTRTARAKGLSARRIWGRHWLPNVLPAVLTVIALQTGFLLGGVVITENIFPRPGIGRLLVNAVLQQDYPLVQGVVVWMAIVYVGLNALTDLIIRWSDPRGRYAE